MREDERDGGVRALGIRRDHGREAARDLGWHAAGERALHRRAEAVEGSARAEKVLARTRGLVLGAPPLPGIGQHELVGSFDRIDATGEIARVNLRVVHARLRWLPGRDLRGA
jgi:hypothetical protein